MPAAACYHDDFFDAPIGDVLEVAFVWGDYVVAVHAFAQPRDVTIGPRHGADMVVDGVGYGDDNLPLVRYADGDYSLLVHEEMGLRLHQGGESWGLSELVESGYARRRMGGWWELELRFDMRAEVAVTEEVSALVRFSDAFSAGGALRDGAGVDREPLPFVGASGLVHVLFLFLALSMPEGARGLELDGHGAEDRFVQIALTAQQEEPPEPDPSWLESSGSESAARHAGEEGQAGREDAPEEADGRMAIRGPADNEDLQIKRARDLEVATNAGVARELMVASLWGSGDTSIGSDADHALGHLDGAHAGPAKGIGGMGIQGTGRGGAGEDEGSIGLDDVTAGTGIGGDGRGSSCPPGTPRSHCKGAPRLGEHASAVPEGEMILRPPTLHGSLDREIIQRVVRQHRRELKACYEAELQKNRALAGEVTVKFTIAGTGRVVAALVQDSSLGSTPVESCVTNKIRRWIFPEPKKGGIVVVKYPFRFRS